MPHLAELGSGTTGGACQRCQYLSGETPRLRTGGGEAPEMSVLPVKPTGDAPLVDLGSGTRRLSA
jgi:hypothetical protein